MYGYISQMDLRSELEVLALAYDEREAERLRRRKASEEVERQEALSQKSWRSELEAQALAYDERGRENAERERERDERHDSRNAQRMREERDEMCLKLCIIFLTVIITCVSFQNVKEIEGQEGYEYSILSGVTVKGASSFWQTMIIDYYYY